MNEVRESSAKIFINSANKANWKGGTSSSLSVPIQPFILRSDDPTHFVVGVESLSVPLSLYVVNSKNNVVSIYFFGFGGVTLEYTIPPGNYTSTTLVATLNSQWAGYIVWTLNPVSYQLSVAFAYPGTTSVVMSGTANTLLGYDLSGEYLNGDTFQNTINLAYTTGIVVRLDNITTENRCAVAGGGSGVLTRIPITVAPFKILQYFNASPLYTTINQRAIQTIEITLLDDKYEPLILVGNPVWSITLRIDYADKTSKENHNLILDKAARNVLSTKNQMIVN